MSDYDNLPCRYYLFNTAIEQYDLTNVFFSLIIEIVLNSSQDGSKPENASFLNDLAAKMAAGPPKKPVGLVKKSAVAEQAEKEAKADLHQSALAQMKLGAILNSSIGPETDEHSTPSKTGSSSTIDKSDK